MHGFAFVMRKLFAAVALLLITSVFPAMASLGFCATEPCCRSHEKAVLQIGTHPPCCNETSCSTLTAKPAELPWQTKNVHASTDELPIVVTAELIAPAHATVVSQHERLPIGSPPTQQRLATLSTLLI